MIRGNTWIVLLLLAALIGFAVYFNQRKETAAAEVTPTAAETYLFTAAEGSPTDIHIEAAAGESVLISRDPAGAWVIKAPIEGAASQGLVQAAADQIGAMGQLDQIQISPAAVGLDAPGFILTIKFSGGRQHKVAIGMKTVTDSGYYVRLDDETATRIITTSSIDALLNLLESPPYEQTPTPPAVPSGETPEGAGLTATPVP